MYSMHMTLRLVAASITTAWLWPVQVVSAQTAKLPANPGYEQVLKMALALVVVLAVVLVLARVMKNLRGFGATSDSMEVVGQLALGARERLLIVRVDNTRLLLGVSAAGISRLHDLGEAELADITSATGGGNFAEQLRAQASVQNS